MMASNQVQGAAKHTHQNSPAIIMNTNQPHHKKKKKSTAINHNSQNPFQNRPWITHLLVCAVSMQIGILIGQSGGGGGGLFTSDRNLMRCDEIAASNEAYTPPIRTTYRKQQQPQSLKPARPQPLPNSLKRMFAGMGRVSRDEFISMFDAGVPWDPTTRGNEDVLMLYSDRFSLPYNEIQFDGSSSSTESQQSRSSGSGTSSGSSIPMYTAKDGTANCDVMKMVLTEPQQRKHCIAIVGQWESYHIYKWIRKEQKDKKKTNTTTTTTTTTVATAGAADVPALKHVSRSHSLAGDKRKMPGQLSTKNHWKELASYLNSLDDSLARLKPILEQATSGGGRSGKDIDNKSVVAIVSNFGHSELLFNFACTGRARGIDLSRVVVFATDAETFELATSLDLAVFDVRGAFGTEIADAQVSNTFADGAFKNIVMAKFYSIHLIMTLGFNVLFQDADVMWYKNPLEYFAKEQLDSDLVFQDDGSRGWFYAPHSACTGFFFMQNTGRSMSFINTLVRMGDLVEKALDQEAMAVILNEQVSLLGLRVKVLGRDSEEGQLFPTGFHFQNRPEFMADLMLGKTSPYVFHMNWNSNREEKKQFFQQMGDWFLRDECRGQKTPDLMQLPLTGGDIFQCCSAEPIYECHFHDVPSKDRCDSTLKWKEERPSFW